MKNKKKYEHKLLGVLFFVILTLHSSSVNSFSLFGEALIEGNIKDYWGSPVQGVHIKIKNSQYNAFSDKHGKYSVHYPLGTFTILYTKDGYSSYEMVLTLSSKDKFPAEEITLVKIPEQEGVYFYKKDKIVPLVSNKIGVAGTFIQSISGINVSAISSTCHHCR